MQDRVTNSGLTYGWHNQYGSEDVADEDDDDSFS